MAAQAALIAETIAGMKKVVSGHQYCKLLRDKIIYSSSSQTDDCRVTASDSDDSFQPLTNRGNKLKRKAQYVRKGQLDIPNGPKTYKRVRLFSSIETGFKAE